MVEAGGEEEFDGCCGEGECFKQRLSLGFSGDQPRHHGRILDGGSTVVSCQRGDSLCVSVELVGLPSGGGPSSSIDLGRLLKSIEPTSLGARAVLAGALRVATRKVVRNGAMTWVSARIGKKVYTR